MDNARLKALARLAQSKSDAARTALSAELDEVTAILQGHTEYDRLLHSLEVLNVIGYRFGDRTVGVIEQFIQTIETRRLAYSQTHDAFADYIAKFSNAQSLIVKAIEVVVRLRYYETRAVFHILLGLYGHPSENVQKQVQSGLDSLAKYDLDVFYGEDRKGGLGTAPQNEMLEALERMDDSALKANQEASLRLLTGMLSPILEGVSWTYKAATISHSPIPALPPVSDIRKRSIRLLFRLYALAEHKQQKLAVMNALSEGTRTDQRSAADKTTRAMIAGNSVEVLAFFEQLVPTEDLQIVQGIESHSYGIFRDTLNEEVKSAALKIEQIIRENQEYAIYRTLVGFDGIFGRWSEYQIRGQQFEAIERERRQRASEFACSITADTYGQWRKRILEYAKTESNDLATFPVFYHFLAELAVAQPELALKIITEDTTEIARFLIPILVSLWNGSHRAHTRTLIESWIREAQPGHDHHLFAAVKMFLSASELDIELLESLLQKATELKDVPSVRQVVTVAIVRGVGAGDAVLRRLLFPALDVLTGMRDANWIFEAWFRKEVKHLFVGMDAVGIEHVLRNLLVLDSINYYAEEVLDSLAQQSPEQVMRFLIARIALEARMRPDDVHRDFEAVPHGFHRLDKVLAKIPGPAVGLVLEQYRDDATLFTYRGAKLLKDIFPTMSEEFEAELLQLVREGGDSNLEFVLGVLRNYHGEPFVHRLCKAVVKAADPDSPLLNEVALALQATGVVSGEFGMAEAYERKKQEVLDWLSDPDEQVRAFAKRYIADLEQMRDAEAKRAEEDIALRKHRFGEE